MTRPVPEQVRVVRCVQVPGRRALRVDVAVAPEHPACREGDDLDRVLVFLVRDDPVGLRSEERVVAEPERHRRGTAGTRISPEDVSCAVDEEHAVVAPIGDQQITRDRTGRRKTRLRTSRGRPARICGCPMAGTRRQEPPCDSHGHQDRRERVAPLPSSPPLASSAPGYCPVTMQLILAGSIRHAGKGKHNANIDERMMNGRGAVVSPDTAAPGSGLAASSRRGIAYRRDRVFTATGHLLAPRAGIREYPPAGTVDDVRIATAGAWARPSRCRSSPRWLSHAC